MKFCLIEPTASESLVPGIQELHANKYPAVRPIVKDLYAQVIDIPYSAALCV